jgi:hypothetical protein
MHDISYGPKRNRYFLFEFLNELRTLQLKYHRVYKIFILVLLDCDYSLLIIYMIFLHEQK